MTTPTIGVIGAGNMGGAVARRLATGDFDVRVFDLDPDAVARCVDSGATAAGSATEAADGVDFLVTSLPLPEHVVATYTELLPSLDPHTVCVDVSTIDPTTGRQVADLLSQRDVPFVSCPLGKTPQAAEAGDIPVFVGGDDEAVDRIGPLLERMSTSVHRMGTVEAATMFKLVSNLVGMTNVAVLAEGYLLARRAGIEPDVFAAALKETGAYSFQSDVRLPWIVDEDYAARFAVNLAAKDVRLAVDAAARWGIPTPVAAAGLGQLVAAMAHGYGAEDVVAVVKVCAPPT